MEKEYSNEVKGRVHAYRFTTDEKQIIAKALKPEIKKLEKKIQKIENDPNNEGQVTYACRIDQLENQKKELLFIINEFCN